MTTQERPGNITAGMPKKFLIGLAVALVICVIGIFVAPGAAALLFFGTALSLTVSLVLIGGAFWRQSRRERRAPISR